MRPSAGVAQLVEHQLPKLRVVGSSPIARLMTYDEAVGRLTALARKHDGVVSATDVEADEELASDKQTVSAAAHALASSTNVFASPRDDGWFPYSEIRFTLL